jgi:hypothetical protein
MISDPLKILRKVKEYTMYYKNNFIIVCCLMMLSLNSYAQDTSCSGTINSVTTTVGSLVDDSLLLEGSDSGIGNFLSVTASFTGNTDIVLCSLDSVVDTEAPLAFDASDIDPAQVPLGFSQQAAFDFLKSQAKMDISAALCQQWFTVAQMALLTEFTVELNYPSNKLASCDDLAGTSNVYPVSLQVTR